jgi:hypothetical protein
MTERLPDRKMRRLLKLRAWILLPNYPSRIIRVNLCDPWSLFAFS